MNNDIDYLKENFLPIEGTTASVNENVYTYSHGQWVEKLRSLSLESTTLIANDCGCGNCGCK